MARLGTAYLALRAKQDELERDLKKAHTKIDAAAGNMQKSVSKINFRNIGLAAAAAAGVAVYAIGSIGKSALDAASDLEETGSKFDVVFSGQEKKAAEMAKVLVDAYAMSTREAKQFLGNVQDTLVPMGLSAKEAANMSNEIVKLSADLGSFNNLPTADVMRDITSALVGETEPMRKYGVVLSAARIEQEALTLGLADTKKQLTFAHKAQAAYSLIVQGSTAAIGDMQRTSESYANQTKKLNAQIEDTKAIIGNAFIPIAKEAVSAINDIISSLIKSGNIEAWAEGLASGFQSIINTIKNTSAAVSSFLDDISAASESFIADVEGLFHDAFGVSLSTTLQKLGNDIGLTFKTIFTENLAPVINEFVEVLRTIELAWSGIKLAGNLAIQGIAIGLDEIIGFANALIEPINAILKRFKMFDGIEITAFEKTEKSLETFRQSSADVTKSILKDIKKTNAEYDTIKKNIVAWSDDYKHVVFSSNDTAKKIIRDNKKIADTAKKTADSTKNNIIDVDTERKKALREQQSLSDKVYKSIKSMSQETYEKQVALIKDETRKFIAGGGDKEVAARYLNQNLKQLSDDYHTYEINKIAERSRLQEKFYTDLGIESEKSHFDKLKLLYAEHNEFIKLGGDKEIAAKWLESRKVELNKKAEEKKIAEWRKSHDILADIGDSIESNTRKSVNRMVDDFVAGEDMKKSVSKITGDFLVDTSSTVANKMFNKSIDKIVDMIGALIGQGAAGVGGWAASQGGWPNVLGQMALYTGAGITSMLAARGMANQFRAEGGWVGSHPGGGFINAGSGIKDDVFLGYTDGGKVRNWGMGGEFVVNKESARQFAPLLHAINDKKFADGGSINLDWEPVANNLAMGTGFSFLHGLKDTGDWKAGLAAAIGYVGTSIPAMFASKYLSNRFREDGGFLNDSQPTVAVDRNFFLGGLIEDIIDFVSDPIGTISNFANSIVDAFYDAIEGGKNFFSDLIEHGKGFGSSIVELFKDVHNIPAEELTKIIAKLMDEVMNSEMLDWLMDLVRAPFKQVAKDIVTPGKYYSAPLDLIENELDHAKKTLFPFFENGGPVTGDGLIYAHAGERVLNRQETREYNTKTINNNQPINIALTLDGRELSRFIYNKSRDGGLQLHERALVSR